MKQLLFVVYDSKAELYNFPFQMQTKGQAIRGFTDLANDVNTTIGQHPEDFTLFQIGEYEDTKGEFTILDAKQSIGTALEFKREVEQ